MTRIATVSLAKNFPGRLLWPLLFVRNLTSPVNGVCLLAGLLALSACSSQEGRTSLKLGPAQPAGQAPAGVPGERAPSPEARPGGSENRPARAEAAGERSRIRACDRPVPPAPEGSSLVAQALVASVAIFPEPGAAPGRELANPQPSGTALVFLVKQKVGEWIEVYLPVRPNGSTGWIRAPDVTLAPHDFRIIVEIGDHCVTVFRGKDVFMREPAGVGRQNTPTPGGIYYIKELFEPPDPRSLYGPYAYSLSGFSDALTSFRGKEAVIGIHGTNRPSSIGRDVSSGCIRLKNEAITRLAGTLPLGVPVEIRD